MNERPRIGTLIVVWITLVAGPVLAQALPGRAWMATAESEAAPAAPAATPADEPLARSTLDERPSPASAAPGDVTPHGNPPQPEAVVAPSNEASTSDMPGLPEFGDQLVKMLLVLGGIIVVLLTLAKLLPRLGAGRRPTGAGAIVLVDSFQLEPRKRLYLMSVDGRRVLLASSEQGVHVVSDRSIVSRPRTSEPMTTPVAMPASAPASRRSTTRQPTPAAPAEASVDRSPASPRRVDPAQTVADEPEGLATVADASDQARRSAAAAATASTRPRGSQQIRVVPSPKPVGAADRTPSDTDPDAPPPVRSQPVQRGQPFAAFLQGINPEAGKLMDGD